MIKRLLTISFASAALFATAQQQAPNSGFETWSGNYPSSWGSIDEAVSAVLGYQNTVIENNTAPFAGAADCKLEPKYNLIIGQNIPGIIVSGSFDVVISPFSIGVNGIPYTSRPTDMTFYYKFSPTSGDTAGAAVWLYKYNSSNGMRDTMAYGDLEITTAAASYTMGTVTLNYHNTATPDSIAIIFASTLTQITVGTSFTVDGVSMNGTASGVDETAKDMGLMVYPNPANDIMNFSISRDANLSYVEIYDLNGRKLNTVNVLANTLSTLPTSELSEGMYFYGAFNTSGERVYTGKFEVKH
ncbi:MAG: T9SS type A sorting domain-containing protein [Flavobacteriales bacterium]